LHKQDAGEKTDRNAKAEAEWPIVGFDVDGCDGGEYEEAEDEGEVKGKEEDDWRGQEELYWAQESTTEDESLCGTARRIDVAHKRSSARAD
jgi:hypothetical protein